VPAENVIDSFTCALKQMIPLHGTLFITDRSLYFYSAFHGEKLPMFNGRSTKIVIPFSEIYRPVKMGSLLLLNKQIKVFRQGDLKPIAFVNFLFRDKCFKALET